MSQTVEPTNPPTPPRFGVAGWAFVTAAFVIGFCNFPLRVLGHEFDHVPGDLIDNRLNLCVLEHGYQYLTGKVDQFWNMPTYYPARGVTAASDAHIGMLPLYSALRACGLSPERAFQGWFLIPFAMNFAAAAWASRRLGLGPVGAGVAAFVFTYGIPLAAQVGHGQLLPRFLAPLALVFAWEWLCSPRSSWRVAAVAACVVYQTYISVYIGYLLCLALAAGGISALVLSRGRLPWRDIVLPNWRVWAWRIAVILVAAAAIKPLVNAHARNGSEVSREVVHALAPRYLAWVTPAAVSVHFQEFTRSPELKDTLPWAGEEQLFAGRLPLAAVAVGLALAVVVLVRRKPFGEVSSAVAVGACSSVFLALLVTKFGANGETWYYEPLLRLPGASGIRAINRVVLVLLFPVGFVLGAILDTVVRAAARRSRGAAVAIAILGLAAVAADQRLVSLTGDPKKDWSWVRTPISECVKRRERMVAAVRAHPDAKLVYVFPSLAGSLGGGGVDALHLDAMFAAQELGLPTANGCSGHSPLGWGLPGGYRALMKWLTVENEVPLELVEGLVVFGEPVPDPDLDYDRAMRAKYPPRPVPATP